MKNYHLLPLLAGLVFSTLAIGTASAATLTVTVKNVASGKGMVLAALCDKDTFMKKCAHTTAEKAVPDSMTLSFKDVPPGKYALNLYHDENDNKKLDRSEIGIPLEGYGFSRDARGHRGPPTFDDAMFEIKDGKNETTVNLNY